MYKAIKYLTLTTVNNITAILTAVFITVQPVVASPTDSATQTRNPSDQVVHYLRTVHNSTVLVYLPSSLVAAFVFEFQPSA